MGALALVLWLAMVALVVRSVQRALP